MMYNILLNFCAEKTQEMCVKAFNVNPYNYNFEYIPDWFITPEMIENSDGCCDSCDDKFHGYKERKAQKAQIKDELTPIAWHPDRVINLWSYKNKITCVYMHNEQL